MQSSLTLARDPKPRSSGQAGRTGPDDQLATLIGAIRSVTSRRLTWSRTADLVAEHLTRHLPSADVLTSDQRSGDPAGARTHLLHAETDGSFSAVALVLRPGQSTPIHDHVTWCVFGVLQGTEREERYVLRADGHLELAGTSANRTGAVEGLAPPGDIHRVRNDDIPAAISLHIYGTGVSRLGTSVRRVYGAPAPVSHRHRVRGGDRQNQRNGPG